MHFKTVYYSQFWYSRFANPDLAEYFGNNLRREVDLHKRRFRLLAIFFEKIYIPRTHLLTQHHPSQWKVPDQVFSSDDFRYLFEKDIFSISSFPGLDDKEDNERILARSALTQDVFYAKLEQYLRKIPTTSRYEIQSSREAQSNLQNFPEYGESLERIGPNVSLAFLEVFKKSNLGEIPFFHESFVKHLALTFPAPQFKRLWRDTNSIYLISGAPNQEGVTPYFCPDIESLAYRFEPHRIDRYLFNPDILEIFLNEFLPRELTNWLLYGPINLVYEFLDQGSECGQHLQAFRAEYFDLVQRISDSQRSIILMGDATIDLASKSLIDALHGKSDSQFGVAAGVLSDASQVAKATGADSGGIASSLISPAVKYGSSMIREFLRNRRNPKMATFLSALNKSLSRSMKKNG